MAYLKASPHEKTYSNYLQTASKVEKEESMELSQNPQSQAIDNTAKPKTTSFFPLWKLKGNQLVPKVADTCLAHLEEESTKGIGKWKAKTLTALMGLPRVHGVPHEGCEGCPSGGEVLLSLQQPRALNL